jgi:hypothetical protein
MQDTLSAVRGKTPHPSPRSRGPLATVDLPKELCPDKRSPSPPDTRAALNNLSDPATTAKLIDEIVSGAAALFRKASGFEAEVALAQAVAALRGALSPQIMSPILSLMNSDLGFRTDRDPRRTNPSTGRRFEAYPVDVVRECYIESRLRGFRACGNEWNILAGRFYACRNGFRRKLADGSTFPGLSDFRDWYGAPRLADEGSALVKCSAEWKLCGKADGLEREFPVRTSLGSAADAILGKAERKLLRAVHDRLLGTITPEAEIGDEMANREVELRNHLAAAPGSSAEGPAEATEDRSFSPDASSAAEHPGASPTPQEQLANLVLGAGYSLDQLRKWGAESGNLHDAGSLLSFGDIALPDCRRLLRNPPGVLSGCSQVKQRTEETRS